MRAAVETLLADVVVVDDLAAARAIVAARPDLVVATRAGDVLSRHRAVGRLGHRAQRAAAAGGARRGARGRAQADRRRRARCGSSSPAPPRRRPRRRAAHEATLDRLNESDAALAAVAEQLGQLGSTARAAQRRGRAAAAVARGRRRARSSADTRASWPSWPSGSRPPRSSPPRARRRSPRAARAGPARRARVAPPAAAEIEARLALRTGEERARALAGRAESLERAAQAERVARERAAERERRGRARPRSPRPCAPAPTSALGRARRVAAPGVGRARRRGAARGERDRARRRRAVPRSTRAPRELERLTDVVHRDEVARAEQRLRIEALQARAVEELGVDPAVLLDGVRPGPGRAAVDPGARARGRPATPRRAVPYVRERAGEAAARRRAGARAARPGQPAGARGVRRARGAAPVPHRAAGGPQGVPRATCSTSSGRSTSGSSRCSPRPTTTPRASSTCVFARLFPGGEGRLVLTDPDDMLTTGIEVEARPPGKKVKRLSLLSGGERSLTAVALLVAIFKARPSPFYVMDEVEAALDDTNLGRLLEICSRSCGRTRQLIVDHPPEAHDGDRRRALRRLDARRRRHHRHQPAAARGRSRLTDARRPRSWSIV